MKQIRDSYIANRKEKIPNKRILKLNHARDSAEEYGVPTLLTTHNQHDFRK